MTLRSPFNLRWLLMLILSSVSAFAMAEPALIATSQPPAAASFKFTKEPWLAGFTAVYTVKKGSFTIGETKRTLTAKGENSYLFESVTRPMGLAKLLTNGQVIERSTWRFNPQGQQQPLEYTFFNNSEKKKRNVRLNFNWDKQTVTNTINGEPWKMPLVDGAQDKLLYQLLLMRELARGKTKFSYPVADGGKLKTYTLKILGTENIRTPLGRFETVRVLRVHGKRKTTLWCAKQLNYLPVRIEQRKGDHSPVNAILTSVTGLGSL